MVLTDDEARRITGVAVALGLALGLGVTSCAEKQTVTGPEARLGAPAGEVAAHASAPRTAPSGPVPAGGSGAGR
jgi:hypothetical protein